MRSKFAKHIKTFLIAFMLVCSMLVRTSTMTAQTSANSYRYAYTLRQLGSININLIDPENLGNPPTSLSIPIPSNYLIAKAYASPSTEWIALLFSIQGFPNTNIKLINTHSSAIRSLPEFFSLSDTSGSGEPEQILAWSPDSQYIAFRGKLDDTQGQSDIYLYSLASDSVVNLTHDAATQYQISWSRDSHSLAVFSEQCSATCQPNIDIFNIPSTNRQSSVNLTSLISLVSTMTVPSRTTLCHFDWSPDGQYISFIMGCGIDDLYFSEIYLLTVGSGSLTALTSFTTSPAQLAQGPSSEFSTMYAPFWINATTLLLGAYIQEHVLDQVQRTVQQTSSYTPPNNTPTILNNAINEEWSANPVTGELALRSFSLDAAETVQNASVQLATLNGSILTVSRSMQAGCSLSWTPDGNILSYYVPSNSYIRCKSANFASSLMFFNKTTGQVTSYSTLGQNPLGIGWVSISQAAPTNTPTPTPTHTNTPVPSTLKMQYFAMADERGTVWEAIGPELNIVNTGASSVPLNQLKVRYYFTREGTSTLRFVCYYTDLPGGCGSITKQFVTITPAVSGADTYLELGFSSGTLAANSQTGEIYFNIHKADWSNFDQSNDYSFNGTFTDYTDWNKITLYRNGSLVWGVEPH